MKFFDSFFLLSNLFLIERIVDTFPFNLEKRKLMQKKTFRGKTVGNSVIRLTEHESDKENLESSKYHINNLSKDTLLTL